MIPLQLYMRNFICYREQSLDFRGIHLACLTGNNGHGKSAILDAITWVLWGYSRVGARRDDELIHLGQTEMEVEIEFQLVSSSEAETPSENGTRYRVIRKRTRKKRGQSSLELQGWDPVEGRFRSLTEPTMAQTQARINELLRMEYETFINSAFLLQGRADEFTIKRPTERKQVLGDILGLQVYQRYERLSKETAREKKERGDQLLAAIEQIDRELAREDEYRQAVQSAEEELERLRTERAESEAAYEQVQASLQRAEAARQQLADLEERIALAQGQSERLSADIASRQQHLESLETALRQEDEIESGFEAYQATAAENEGLNAKLSELVTLNERHSEVQRRLDAARHDLDKQRAGAADTVRRLQEATGALEQEAEWEAIKSKLTHLDEREAEKERSSGEIQALTADVARLTSENERAQEDAVQIKEKISLLSGTGDADHEPPEEDGGHCPLCGQALAGEESAALLSTFEAELEEARRAYGERRVQIKEHGQRIAALRSAIAEIDRDLRRRTGWQRQEAALAHLVEEAQRARDDLPDARRALQVIKDGLAQGNYGLEEREALGQVETELGELGYEADAHKRVKAELERLRAFEERMRTLREARSSIDTVRLALAQLDQSRSEVDKRLAADRAQAEELDQVVSQLPDLQRRALQARQAAEGAHDREQQASLKLGAERNKVEYCADLRKQRVTRRGEERQLREEQGIYQELQQAFGRNGIQAMLIEGAIPDIEQEANHLLARMTGGAMQVRFETQRDTKSGTTVETLDIHVVDRLGPRSYETYSGGERYRINFAIRMALSKLLARRAGAQLQLLVIDEGFGTQDTEGRDGLIDAINAVKDDFACILVITHIEELKDVFNVRIEVTKTEQGSEIAVL